MRDQLGNFIQREMLWFYTVQTKQTRTVGWSAHLTGSLPTRPVTGGGNTVEVGATRTKFEFENEGMRIQYNFLAVRDTNVNFFLCEFQRFELYYKRLF